MEVFERIREVCEVLYLDILFKTGLELKEIKPEREAGLKRKKGKNPRGKKR